jgi:hypothetical protein
MKTYNKKQVKRLLDQQRQLCAQQITGPMFGTLPIDWKNKVLNADMPKEFTLSKSNSASSK